LSASSPYREWNSSEYHRLSQPQVSWGKRVLSRLRLHGDECVLDAGCGTGRLTAELIEALPKGCVVGVDLSQNMLHSARSHLASLGAKPVLVAADFLHLPFQRVFDGIVSTAAFHWVLDHDALFASLSRTLCSGGWLHAQCGGAGNLERLRNRVKQLAQTKLYAPYLAHFPEPWFYADAEEAGAVLRRVGFVNVETSLEPALTLMESAGQYRDFVKSIILRNHLEQLPSENLQSRFLDEVTKLAAADDPAYSLDYWRLNLAGDLP
jgi:trans-aconitate 2-methyltransferase